MGRGSDIFLRWLSRFEMWGQPCCIESFSAQCSLQGSPSSFPVALCFSGLSIRGTSGG